MSKHNHSRKHFSENMNPPINLENTDEIVEGGVDINLNTTEHSETYTNSNISDKVVDEPVLGKVKCTKLNVRSEATTDTDNVIKVITNNDVVFIEEKESTKDFYKVTLESGIEGYCMKQYIERV